VVGDESGRRVFCDTGQGWIEIKIDLTEQPTQESVPKCDHIEKDKFGNCMNMEKRRRKVANLRLLLDY
jgi:hypothetical protein